MGLKQEKCWDWIVAPHEDGDTAIYPIEGADFTLSKKKKKKAPFLCEYTLL